MKKPITNNDLNNAIQQLQAKQAVAWVDVKEHFNIAYDSLKPINIISNIFEKVTQLPNLKNRIINKVIVTIIDYVSLFITQSKILNLLQKILFKIIK
jgi:hypothetical protein